LWLFTWNRRKNCDTKRRYVQEAREWGADLIVVGSHGYGPLRSVLLGSVARSVLTEAPCSVLVARVKSALHVTESVRSSEATLGPARPRQNDVPKCE